MVTEIDTKDYMAVSPKPTSTPDIHHVHVRMPIVLWKRFRKSFPEQGDVARVVCAAMDMYLDAWERRPHE